MKSEMGDDFNVPFDRDTKTGEYQYCLEGGHSAHRILHRGDQSGKAIMLALNKALRAHPNVTLLENKMVFQLKTADVGSGSKNKIVEGAYVFDEKIEDVTLFEAKNTVLATGGLGSIYQHTSNPPSARGDGVALA